MPTPIYIVDAFTAEPFAGNPAAVCLLMEEADPAWMQRVAAEMNLSETAFVRPIHGGFELRWFTPGAEVELCGHATLAAAHLLWSRNLTQAVEMIYFETLYSGGITCTREQTGLIGLDMPMDTPTDKSAPDGLFEALGIDAGAVVNTAAAKYDWLVELRDEDAVRAARPRFEALSQIDCRGVAITARADDADADIASRFFAPSVRVAEDPVTGSIHCALGPYWQYRIGRDVIRARQLSERGGWLRVTIHEERVELAGEAVTVLAGDLEA